MSNLNSIKYRYNEFNKAYEVAVGYRLSPRVLFALPLDLLDYVDNNSNVGLYGAVITYMGRRVSCYWAYKCWLINNMKNKRNFLTNEEWALIHMLYGLMDTEYRLKLLNRNDKC